jgi:hypothetical protein
MDSRTAAGSVDGRPVARLHTAWRGVCMWDSPPLGGAGEQQLPSQQLQCDCAACVAGGCGHVEYPCTAAEDLTS